MYMIFKLNLAYKFVYGEVKFDYRLFLVLLLIVEFLGLDWRIILQHPNVDLM